MELGLGRRADYTLRAVFHLARDADGRYRPSREIAAAMDVPSNYLPQLLAMLVSDGIVESRIGRIGGYRLARPAAEVTLLEVIDAVEAPQEATCVFRGGSCAWEARCAFHEPWVAAKQALTQRLAATTFADVVTLAEAAPQPQIPADDPAG